MSEAIRQLRKLRHLYSTIERFLPVGRGNCMQRAVAMVMDVPTSKLVVGTLMSDRAYLHAWVMDRDMFFDPSCFEEDEGLTPYAMQPYIDRHQARDIQIVDRPNILAFARRGGLSKWMLRRDDTHHTLGTIMGHALLDELEIAYEVDDQGFLFPAQAQQGDRA